MFLVSCIFFFCCFLSQGFRSLDFFALEQAATQKYFLLLFGDFLFFVWKFLRMCPHSRVHTRDSNDAVYCSVLQCVAVSCSVLQCVAVCCSVLQCVVCRPALWQSSQGHYFIIYFICDFWHNGNPEVLSFFSSPLITSKFSELTHPLRSLLIHIFHMYDTTH